MPPRTVRRDDVARRTERAYCEGTTESPHAAQLRPGVATCASGAPTSTPTSTTSCASHLDAAHGGAARAAAMTAERRAGAGARRVRRPRGDAPPARRDRPAHGAAARRGSSWWDALRADVRYARARTARDARSSPSRSCATLAVGIGAAADDVRRAPSTCSSQPPPHVAAPERVRKPLRHRRARRRRERAHLRRDRRSRSTSGCATQARALAAVAAYAPGEEVRRRRAAPTRELVQRDAWCRRASGRSLGASPLLGRSLARRRGASGHRRTGRRARPRATGGARFGGDPAVVGTIAAQ